MKNYLVEFIGTFFLMLAVALSGLPIAVGLALMVMIYMGGHISGGHYNPAVSVAVWFRGALSGKELAPYIGSQLLGAIASSFVALFLMGEEPQVLPSGHATVMQSLVAEMLFTYALCAVVLSVATSSQMKGNFIYGWAIGAVVIVGAYCVGGLSGGAFNPAIGTGPALVNLIGGGSDYMSTFIYWVGPLAGAFLAGFTFKVIES